jgi:hypothetical protein
MKTYPDSQKDENDYIKKREHLINNNGLSDYATSGKNTVQKAHGFYRKATSTALGKAVTIISLIILFFCIMILILGFSALLGSGNPIGIVKLFVLFIAIVGLYFLFYV